MSSLVEMFLQNYYGSFFTYENNTHGGMSRYLCRNDIRRYYNQTKHNPYPFTPQPNNLRASDYFTGNQEENEINLGEEFYLDLSDGKIKHIHD
jgi:hypothetical protein